MLLLLSSGCAVTTDTPVDPWIELGVGQQSWQPFEEDVELVFGSQGGWHVDLTLRFGGWGPDGLELEYQAVDVEADEVISYLTTATLSEASVLPDADGWQRVGDRVVFEIASDGEVLGRSTRFEVVATDGEREVRDSATGVVVDEVE